MFDGSTPKQNRPALRSFSRECPYKSPYTLNRAFTRQN